MSYNMQYLQFSTKLYTNCSDVCTRLHFPKISDYFNQYMQKDFGFPQQACGPPQIYNTVHFIGGFKKHKGNSYQTIQICSSKFMNYLAMKQKQTQTNVIIG